MANIFNSPDVAVNRLFAQRAEVEARIARDDARAYMESAKAAASLLSLGFADGKVGTFSDLPEPDQTKGLWAVIDEGAIYEDTGEWTHRGTLSGMTGISIGGLVVRISELEGDYESLIGQIELSASLEYVNDQIGSVSNALSSLESTVANIETPDLSEVYAELGLKASIEYVNEERDILSSAISGIDSRVTTTESDILEIESALDAKAEISYVDEETGHVADALSGIDFRVGVVESDVLSLSSQLDAKASIAYVDQETGSIVSAVAGLDARTTFVEGEIATISTEVNTKASLDYVNDEVGTVASAVAGLEAIIDSIGEEDIQSIFAALSLKADIEYVDTETGELQNALGALDIRTTVVEGDLSQLSSEVDLKASISYVDDETGAIGSSVASLEQRVTATESQTVLKAQYDANGVVTGLAMLELGASEGDSLARISGALIELDGDTVVTEDFEVRGDVIVGGTLDASKVAISGGNGGVLINEDGVSLSSAFDGYVEGRAISWGNVLRVWGEINTTLELQYARIQAGQNMEIDSEVSMILRSAEDELSIGGLITPGMLRFNGKRVITEDDDSFVKYETHTSNGASIPSDDVLELRLPDGSLFQIPGNLVL